jgi:acyl-coenzyme A thioesterase PaaI-like protein
MHGGLVTTLADEIAAWTLVGLLEKFGFTAQIEAKLLRPIRIDTEVVGRGRIVRATSRIVYVAVHMTQSENDVFRGEFAFVLMDQARAEQMLGQSLPEAWKKLCR